MVFPPVTDGSTPPADEYPVTPDGRYVVVRGRLGERPTRVSQRRSESICAGGEGGDAPANRANLYDEVNPKVIGGLGVCQGGSSGCARAATCRPYSPALYPARRCDPRGRGRQLYSARTDEADGPRFIERASDDRH